MLRAQGFDAVQLANGMDEWRTLVLRSAHDTGTVEAGKAADLIPVAADPLQDPAALADPGTVTLVLQGGVIRKDLR